MFICCMDTAITVPNKKTISKAMVDQEKHLTLKSLRLKVLITTTGYKIIIIMLLVEKGY